MVELVPDVSVDEVPLGGSYELALDLRSGDAADRHMPLIANQDRRFTRQVGGCDPTMRIDSRDHVLIRLIVALPGHAAAVPHRRDGHHAQLL